jgi:hypothetical protein
LLLQSPATHRRNNGMARFGMLRLLLLVFLVLLVVGALPAWPYSTGWGYYPSGGLSLLLLLVIILALVGWV